MSSYRMGKSLDFLSLPNLVVCLRIWSHTHRQYCIHATVSAFIPKHTSEKHPNAEENKRCYKDMTSLTLGPVEKCTGTGN